MLLEKQYPTTHVAAKAIPDKIYFCNTAYRSQRY